MLKFNKPANVWKNISPEQTKNECKKVLWFFELNDQLQKTIMLGL